MLPLAYIESHRLFKAGPVIIYQYHNSHLRSSKVSQACGHLTHWMGPWYVPYMSGQHGHKSDYLVLRSYGSCVYWITSAVVTVLYVCHVPLNQLSVGVLNMRNCSGLLLTRLYIPMWYVINMFKRVNWLVKNLQQKIGKTLPHSDVPCVEHYQHLLGLVLKMC